MAKTSKDKKTHKKQTKKAAVRKAYGVKLLLSRHKELRRLKNEAEEPSIHGNKFWGSSYLLMDYFKKHPIKKRSRVMELGCGWGLASIFLAKQYNARVTGVDADDAVFPFLELHARHNEVKIDTLKRRFEKLTKKELAKYDVLIGADICFWDELEHIHYNLIKRALKAGVKKIVYADPMRSPFLRLADDCIEDFYAEYEPWSIKKPRRYSGSLLIIENA